MDLRSVWLFWVSVNHIHHTSEVSEIRFSVAESFPLFEEMVRSVVMPSSIRFHITFITNDQY